MGRTKIVAVSVVIPVYNGVACIGGAVRSVQQQTLTDLEVIVVDDCSTDSTEALVKTIAERDGRVRYVRMPQNGGPSVCRNAGIDQARGEWIALLDADDRFEPDRLANLLRLGDQTDADITSDNVLMHYEGEPDYTIIDPADMPAPRQMSFADFMEGCIWRPGRRRSAYVFMKPVLRRTFLDRTGLRYDGGSRNGEDFVFYISCFLAKARWVVTPVPGYRYTIEEGSQTDRMRIEDRRIMLDKLTQAMADKSTELDHRLFKIVRTHWRINQADYTVRAIQASVRAGDVRGSLRLLTSSRHALTDVARQVFTESRVAPRVLARRLIRSNSARSG